MANKNTFQRYKKTSVKAKRSLSRTLNRFTIKNKFEYVSIKKVKLNSKNELEFGNSSINLEFFMQDDIDSLKRILDLNTDVKDAESNIIFNVDVTKNDMSSTECIFEAIDNLISINKQYQYKEALKVIVKEYSENSISIFFNEENENEIIKKIQSSFNSSHVYAKKNYNEIKHRVRYPYVGMYSVNDEITNKVHTLTPKFLSSYDILKSRIDYVLKREWLLSDSLLNELRSRLPKKQIRNGYYEENLVELISDYFNIVIVETEDDTYSDAVEFLKYLYLEAMNEDAPYSNPNYVPYEYEFLTEYSIENFNNQITAKNYIEFYNDAILQIEEMDDVDKEFEKQEAEDKFNQLNNAPIDAETYYDSSIKDEFRKSASSIITQWNGFYASLLNGVLSEKKEKNEYYLICQISTKLLAQFNQLKVDGAFLENGSINIYGKAYQNLKEELSLESYKINSTLKRRKIDSILRIKKIEWKFLYKSITENTIFYALEDFDYETLKFRETEIT